MVKERVLRGRTADGGRAGRASSGYTLVAVVIGMAILTILLAAVGPTISTIMKRDREDELMFRGRQYARAILQFQKRFGRYPNTLKELSENRPRTIRKLWKDPMCRCDNWHLLILGSPDSVPFQAGGAGGAAQGSGLPQPPPRPTPTPKPFGSAGSFGAPEGIQGPIVGVRSNIHEEALREWRGRKYYDEWSFIAGDADRDLNGQGTQVGGAPPGMPGPVPPTPKPN